MTDGKSNTDHHLDVQELITEDIRVKKEKDALREKHRGLNMKDYLQLLASDTRIGQNAPARVHEVILSYGKELISEQDELFPDGDKHHRYPIFSKLLYGIDSAIEAIVHQIEVGALGGSTGKQITLLVGPPGSGKSTVASILKRALENYVAQPVFKIKDCPINENPIHLVPRHLRPKVEKDLGIKIEGDLCPVCRKMLLGQHTDKSSSEVRWWDVPVEVFSFSRQDGRGIGSFEPSDKLTTTVYALVGQPNIAIQGNRGPSDPEAYDLRAGELGKSNRGIFEGREIIKANEEILWAFISVAEEKEFKVQGSSYPHIHIDTLLIGHTNLAEYTKFKGNKSNEALHNRIFAIFVPYPLRMSDEVKIYRKLINEESDFARLKKCHIAPGALELAALFAVMTRLTESDAVDVLTKAFLYDGREDLLADMENEKIDTVDVRELFVKGQDNKDVGKREGMFGLSSRDVLAAINGALVKLGGDNGCLTPAKVIRALRDLPNHRMNITPEEAQRYLNYLSDDDDSVKTWLKLFLVKDVTKAFLEAYDPLCRALFASYMSEVSLWHSQNRQFLKKKSGFKLDDEGRVKEPDEKLMSSIEEQLGISENEKSGFRGELLADQGGNASFGYDTCPTLAEAIQRKVLSDSKELLAAVLAGDNPKTTEEQKRKGDLMSALTKDKGYCPVCAKEAVEKTKEYLSE